MNVSRAEAKELIDGYFITYPKVKEYMQKSIETAREKGYTETIYHRKCYLRDINSHNAVVRGYAERNAINAGQCGGHHQNCHDSHLPPLPKRAHTF